MHTWLWKYKISSLQKDTCTYIAEWCETCCIAEIDRHRIQVWTMHELSTSHMTCTKLMIRKWPYPQLLLQITDKTNAFIGQVLAKAPCSKAYVHVQHKYQLVVLCEFCSFNGVYLYFCLHACVGTWECVMEIVRHTGLMVELMILSSHQQSHSWLLIQCNMSRASSGIRRGWHTIDMQCRGEMRRMELYVVHVCKHWHFIGRDSASLVHSKGTLKQKNTESYPLLQGTS